MCTFTRESSLRKRRGKKAPKKKAKKKKEKKKHNNTGLTFTATSRGVRGKLGGGRK